MPFLLKPHHRIIETLRTLIAEAELHPHVMTTLKSRERASLRCQLTANLTRAWRSYWRMPQYQLARLGGVAAMGLVLGSLYFQQTQETVSGLVSFIALIFLATTFVANINSTSVLQVVALEKTSFCRERFNNMYSVAAYCASWFLVEIPYVFAQMVLYMVTFYPTCKYNMEFFRVAWFAAFSFLYMVRLYIYMCVAKYVWVYTTFRNGLRHSQ